MNAKTLLRYLIPIFVLVVMVQSCKDDEEESNPEFIASSSDFADFRSWTEVATHQGPDPALGAAHQGNDDTMTRTIYFKDNQERNANGEFPVGTIVVKDTRDAQGNTVEVTAMVKRGNDFNSGNNDWEWFMLTPNGQIAQDNGMDLRGASLMNGMCGACHSQAANEDYIFSK